MQELFSVGRIVSIAIERVFVPGTTENIEIIVHRINKPKSQRYMAVMAVACVLVLWGALGVASTFDLGLASWGINNAVPWAVDITNFVFWIGIGHAGTFVSAILLLFGSHWRNSINRSAELMTLVALCCAAFFPFIHAGRPHFAWYWLLPYPNQMGLLPNFRSPIVWDIMAIGTYFAVSVIFWYMGMIPDLYRVGPHLRSKRKRYFYELLSLGWNDSSRQRAAHARAYKLLAGLATALVVSVHSVVSFDFAVTDVSGWHSTIFPIYFVAGAIFSGCAMVALLTVLLRYSFKLGAVITDYNLDNLCKSILATALMLGFLFLADLAGLAASKNPSDWQALAARFSTANLPFTLSALACVLALPHAFWSLRARTSPKAIIPICILITFGMWCERFSFIVPSLEAARTNCAEAVYIPTLTEISIFAGTAGAFILLIMLAFRFIPAVSLWETNDNSM